MSLGRSTAVRCDAPTADTPGCHGYVGDTVDGGEESRRLARRAGWRRVDIPSGWRAPIYRGGRGGRVDVCPSCLKRYAAEIAAAKSAGT